MPLKTCAFFLPPIACLILGGILIAFGVHIHQNYATNEDGYLCSYAFLCLGIVPYFFSVFFCIGYAFKNSCCFITFIIVQILAFIGQCIIAYLLTKGAESMASSLANTIDISWENELKNAGAMSIYESTYNCCGRASPHDYIKQDRLPPNSCFYNGADNAPENLYGTGCRIVFESYILKLLHIYTILGWILIATEVIVVSLACAFVCKN